MVSKCPPLPTHEATPFHCTNLFNIPCAKTSTYIPCTVPGPQLEVPILFDFIYVVKYHFNYTKLCAFVYAAFA